MTAYGYARTSTQDQNPALQVDALAAAGVDEIVQEQGSGAGARPLLAALLARLQAGDELVVWRLDRLGRRGGEVIQTMDDLRRRGILLRSLTEGLDGRTPTGRAMMGMAAIFAELERETILERVRAGIALSRAAGRHGRPRRWTADQVRHAGALVAEGTSLRQAARRVGLARSTLADALRKLPSAPPQAGGVLAPPPGGLRASGGASAAPRRPRRGVATSLDTPGHSLDNEGVRVVDGHLDGQADGQP
ncbi:recombinase family protein (plasmid) [Pararoseomonas sp. SCSIO 73927]|uniref:recombinase family protein n=1 Tax=Pararoseomonas sp. SCSIO 73927 TaxID=3114537 RepID=UPI0030D0D310